jgi:hypothetical protein
VMRDVGSTVILLAALAVILIIAALTIILG